MSVKSYKEIGGSSIKLWRGKINGKISDFFKKRSEKLIKQGKKTLISNPSCKFINHCTIIFNFTVNTNEKFQLIHQGKFFERFKNWKKIQEDDANKISQWEKELEEWEKKDINTRGSSPIKPDTEKFPLTEEEMFETIIALKKQWYKKDEIS